MIYLLHPGHQTSFSFLRILGSFHLILLHFPIAFIIMAFIFELIKKEYVARLMILLTAITALPTALFGLVLGYNANYQGDLFIYYRVHMILGFAISLLSILAVLFRQRDRGVYWFSLILLVILVITTGFMGGLLSFFIPKTP